MGKTRTVCNIQPSDFQSVCVLIERSKATSGTVPELVVLLNVLPQGSPFSISLGNLFHLPRERGRKEKQKTKRQLYHAFRVHAALAQVVDSFFHSLWSALALTGQRGLTL